MSRAEVLVTPQACAFCGCVAFLLTFLVESLTAPGKLIGGWELRRGTCDVGRGGRLENLCGWWGGGVSGGCWGWLARRRARRG